MIGGNKIINFILTLIPILIVIFISNCSQQTIYSGKVINPENLGNLKISNKKDLINKLGNPSFVDPIENKLFYYTEKIIEKNFFNKKTEYSYLFVFSLDAENNIISSKAYNLLDKKQISLAKDETQNSIIKRGLIEKIFGGVGRGQIPNTP